MASMPRFYALSLTTVSLAGHGEASHVDVSFLQFEDKNEADEVFEVMLATNGSEKNFTSLCGGYAYQTVRKLYK